MAEEGRDSLQAQIDLAPDILAANQAYRPQYADLDIQTLRRSLLGSENQPGLLQTYRDLEPQLTEFSAKAASSQRERDIADVERLGARATTALREVDPRTAALEDALAQQAQTALESGGALDPAIADQVSQQVRAAQAARGMGFGASDASVEGLFLGREANQLRQQSLGFASQVVAQRRASQGDPFMAILGRPSTVAGMASNVIGQGGSAGAGAPTFDPFSGYASDLNNTNFNASAAAKIAQANNDAAITSAAIGAAGSAASSL
jgi:hypothetical protein